MTAATAVFLLSLQAVSFTSLGIMPRQLVGAALLPAWIPVLRRYIGARALMLWSVIAAVSGVVTAQVSAADHRVSVNAALQALVVLFGFASGIGVILWARDHLSIPIIGLMGAMGFLGNAVLNPGSLGESNPLKFIFALPLVVAVLALLAERKLVYQLGALVLLAAVMATADARSMFGMCVLAAVLVVWQMRPEGRSGGAPSWMVTATLIAIAGASVYAVGTQLLVDGFLGDEAQQRSIAQINTAGSLILGGRPEIAATGALFVSKPWGFGAGVPANFTDLTVAKAGLLSIGYDPNNGYVENYMFSANAIELHSVAGDLWATFGAGGLILALVMIGVLIKTMSVRITRRQASALVAVLVCMALWSMFFGPFYSASRTLVLAFGLLLVKRIPDKADPPPSAPVRSRLDHRSTRSREMSAWNR